jgi:hypothetical protein
MPKCKPTMRLTGKAYKGDVQFPKIMRIGDSISENHPCHRRIDAPRQALGEDERENEMPAM